MSNELVSTKSNMSLWECPVDLQTIKEIYGKNLSQPEFNTLVQLGKATGLNPFLRELWAVKYGDNPASIFIGRDGYRKSAQANPNYDYHHVEAVYSNDKLKYDVQTGAVDHVQDFSARGNLIGAYGIVKRKSSSKPVFVFVDLKEYTTGKSLWGSKPATMIKKVAEAQSLRMAFQDIFGGTYAEEEMQEEKNITPLSPEEKKKIETTPLSLQNKVDDEIVNTWLENINTSADMDKLKNAYADGKNACFGDKDALNKISLATRRRRDELKNPKPASEAVEEFYAEYDQATGEVKNGSA